MSSCPVPHQFRTAPVLGVIRTIEFHASRELLDACKCPVQMQLSESELRRGHCGGKPAEITQHRASGAPTSARCLSTARKIARGHVSRQTPNSVSCVLCGRGLLAAQAFAPRSRPAATMVMGHGR